VEKRKRSGRPKLFEDAKLEALLDEEPCQVQEELTESLGVAQSNISMHLKAIGMIQKQENWITYELKLRDLESGFFTMREQLLQWQKWNGFLYRIITSDEKWIHYDFAYIQSENNHEISTAMHQHPWQSRISVVPSLCSVFGGISHVLRAAPT